MQPKSEDSEDGGVKAVLETLSSLSRLDISRERVAKLVLGVDDREEDIIVMAETSAYFHVAYKVWDHRLWHYVQS